MKRKIGNPGLKGRLLDKSIEAYILALETINRLSIKYRVETFTYLICNAWELLLKAKIIQNANNQRKVIFYKQKRGTLPRSLTLRDCLNKIFISVKDPTRRNIEIVEALRDQAVHLVISQVPKDMLSVFQACVLNYHKRLVEWFGISLSSRISVGMMTIIYDFQPEQFNLNDKVLRRQIGIETAKYLMQFQAKVKQEFEDLGKPAEFSIDIGYKLVLTKNPGSADIALTSGAGGAATQLVEVAKDSGKTHPYRQKDVIAQINTSLNKDTKINQHDIQCVVKYFNVKKRPEYYYQGSVPGSPVQYSQAFIEWLIEQYNEDQTFFMALRQKAKKNS